MHSPDLQKSSRDLDPQAYLTDILTKLVNLWPASRLDDLLPWNWATEPTIKRAA